MELQFLSRKTGLLVTAEWDVAGRWTIQGRSPDDALIVQAIGNDSDDLDVVQEAFIRRNLDRLRLHHGERQNWRCAACTRSRPLELDHILPRGRGGSDTIANTNLKCRECHAGKHGVRETD